MNPNKTVIVILFFIFINGIVSGQELVKVWESRPVFQVPESVLYDPVSGNIFVSNIQGSPAEKDGKGFISVIDIQGNVKKLNWVSGLNAPKGMAVYSGNLFVADVDALVEINIAKAEIVKRYPVKNAAFLNDVAAGQDGMIFVSDTQTGKIHVLNNGRMEELPLEPIRNANGLFVSGKKLYIGSEKIQVMDIKTKKLTVLLNNAGDGIDGLELLGDGNFLFSHWAGRIFIMKGNKLKKLLDTSAKGINSADICFVKDRQLVLVPTFMDNRVVAYRLTK